VLYTGGPWPLGYHGLGDLFVFAFFGLVAVIGSAYLQLNAVSARVGWAALPVACLVTAILVVNNLRDIETDRQAGKHTLAVRLGRGGTRLEYVLLLAAAYLAPLLGWLAGFVSGWFWLPWLTLPLALKVRRVVAREEGRPLNAALKGTAQLHLAFGLLFAVSLWL
jgi:1,4-dihydroxy-2-naphthoate octaprenyltransferase